MVGAQCIERVSDAYADSLPLEYMSAFFHKLRFLFPTIVGFLCLHQPTVVLKIYEPYIRIHIIGGLISLNSMMSSIENCIPSKRPFQDW